MSDQIENTDTEVNGKASKRKTAIDAPRGTFFKLNPSDPKLKIIGVDIRTGQTKVDGPEHRLYDPRALRPISPDRVKNYAYYGIREPITIEVDNDTGDYIVNDGRGRLLGARIVEQEQIKSGVPEGARIIVPALVAKGDEVDLLGLSSALNLHDAEGPVTLAQKAQRLIGYGRSITEVARVFGVSEQTIRNWQSLLTDLAPEVVAKVVAGEVTASAALQLASVPKADQVATLDDVKANITVGGSSGKPSAAQVKKHVAEKAGKPAGLTPKEKLDKVGDLMLKLAGLPKSERTKEALMEYVDRICKISTGKTLEKLETDE